MDNRFDEYVIEEMRPFLDEHGFSASEDGSFKNEKKSAKVYYDEARQMYVLQLADVTDGAVGEYSEAEAWLFDDSQNAKDAASVGVEFTATLRDSLGIKQKRSAGTQIDLPTSEKGESYGINAFTKKFLDIYPQYKEKYKEHFAKYGSFLYLDFFSKSLVPQIREVLKENNKKNVKKLEELLKGAYVQGDQATVNTVVAVLAAAINGDENLKSAALEMLGDDTHFKSSLTNFLPVVSSNKKIRAALIK